jgi:hypothetical protein
MIKKSVRWLLGAIGIGAVLLFIWKGWGEQGNIAGFIMMLWDWFYAVCSGVVETAQHALGML